ncbi:hypothetical protein EI94DRAFT_437361 [Lactarius quietus]|nr:hypothetical protein EI94DRAFT_437361 [Lactarius quietus]
MSASLQVSTSTPNYQLILDKALSEYKKKTKKDLITDPLAVEIRGCDSPDAILTVLRRNANELDQSSDERLTKWLTPTVNVLNALSATVGQGVGIVFPPTQIIFSGINILLVVSVLPQFRRPYHDNTIISRRRRGIRLRAAMHSSNSSTKSKTSSYACRPIQKSHRLRR